MRAKLTLLLLFTSACQRSVIDSSVTSASSVSASLAAATYASGHRALAFNQTATLPLTLSGAVSTSLGDAVGSSTSPPAGVSASASGTVDCATVALIGSSTRGAVVLVNGCTGDGTLTVGVTAGVATDAANQSSVATATRTILVQNTRPAATMALAQPSVAAVDGGNVLTITFTGVVSDLSATNANGEISISGCTTSPEAVISTATVGGHSVATVTLGGGTCASGDSVTVGLNLDHVTNLAGTAGLASANPSSQTYAITPPAPTATLASVAYPGAQTALRAGQTATLALGWTNATGQSLTTTPGTSAAPPAGVVVTVSGTVGCTGVAVQTPSTSGATLAIGGCGGDGTLAIGVAANVATGAGGTSNSASSTQLVRIYNSTPPVPNVNAPTLAGGTDGSATVTYTFSRLMGALSPLNAGGELTIAGCTTTNPGVSVVMSDDGNGHSSATLSLGGGTCASGDTVTIDLNMGLVSDGAGNAGDPATHPTSASYTIP